MPISTFSDKVAAITGTGSGIGEALAISLAQQGCAVAIADIDADKLKHTASQIRGAAVSSHLVDVADRAQMEQFAKNVVAHHGRVNMVFNNAGVSLTDTVSHMSYENFEWLMDINFWGVVYGSKAFLPYLEQVSEAQIINVSSIFGVIALPTQAAYNASKFAVRGFTYAMREELIDTNIGVSCVQPGGVKTNIAEAARYFPSENTSASKEEFTAKFEAIAKLTPVQAAEQILRGVLQNKTQILVGRDAKVIATIERLLPVSYLKVLRAIWS